MPNGNYELIPEYTDAVAAGTYPYNEIIKGNIGYIKMETNGIYSLANKPYPNVVASGELYEQGGYIRDNLLNAVRFTDDEQKIISKYETDLKTYCEEQLQKFITGVTPIDQWDAYVAGYEGYHLQEYLDAYNAAAARAVALIG